VADSAPEDIDALFKLPLGEFTSARNALAARLKKDGRQAEASAAKALTKPSASAWAVNQLYWRHRQAFDRLLATGERLRRAQAGGADAREAANARRAVLRELAALATVLLRDENHSATRDLLRRVTATLEALSTYGEAPGAPVPGRLIDDLEPPGFDAVAGLLPSGGPRRASASPLRVPSRRAETAPRAAAKPSASAKDARIAAQREQEERKRALAAARTAVREAERALNAARKQAERAAAKRATAVARAKELEAERATLERQLARAAADTEAARATANQATAAADEATLAAESAERTLGSARDRLQRATDDKA
jgi:hypothetical protein